MKDHPAYSASEEETGHIDHGTEPGVIWRYTAILAGVSLVLNLILFFVGTSANWIPDEMPASTERFSLVSVILASVIPVFIFGALMVYLANHAPRASRLFTIILTVVLLIAVMIPLVLQDVEPAFQFLLIAMHIVTAGSVFVLTRTAEN